MIDASAELKIELDGLRERVKKLENFKTLARVATIPFSYAAPNPVFVYGYFSLPQAVPQGKIWEVTRYGLVAAPDPSVVLAGVSAWAFVGSQEPQDGNNPPNVINDVCAPAGGIPNVSYPGRFSIILQPNELLIFAVKGLVANQLISGSIAIIEHDKRSFLEQLK